MGKVTKTAKTYPNRRRSSRQRGLAPIIVEQKRKQRTRSRLKQASSLSPNSKKRQKSEEMTIAQNQVSKTNQVSPTPTKPTNEEKKVLSGVKTLTNLVKEVTSVRTQLDMGASVDTLVNSQKPPKNETTANEKNATETEGKQESDEEYTPSEKDEERNSDKDSDCDSEKAITGENSDQKQNSTNTLFNFGFKQSSGNDNNENKIEVMGGVKSISTDTPIAREYIKKNENKLVRVKMNLVKVEDGTFARMDEEAKEKEEEENKSRSLQMKVDEKQKHQKVQESNNSGSEADQQETKIPPKDASCTSSSSTKRSGNEAKSIRHKVQFLRKKSALTTLEESDDDDDSSGSEDSFNTIMSNETSVHYSRAEARKKVPPPHIRYRMGFLLETIPVPPKATEEQLKQLKTPSERCKVILTDLIKFVKSFCKKAVFVSWKNDKGFDILPVAAAKLPEDVIQISKFFQGFKAKLKDGRKLYLNFCLHVPGLTMALTEGKLTHFANLYSYTIYKCNIQAENPKVIGWLVYSYSFTNVNAIKSFLTERSTYEWGLKMTAPSQIDKAVPWNDRTKALEIMVPAENEEEARALISSTFCPKKKNGFKSFTDSYVYVGPERENSTEALAPIFSAMYARHKFRMTHINIVLVKTIVKEIDIKLPTNKQGVFMSLREMILNFPSTTQQLGGKNQSKLFLSVDYTADSKNVWWNKLPGEGGAGYILSYYQWDEGEANEIRKGLGAYLGQYYGKSGIYSSFHAKHWETVESWEWNETEKRFHTPEEKNLAASVLNDPTADVMKAFHRKQMLLESLEKKKKQLEEKVKETGQNTEEKKGKRNNNKSQDVQVLGKFDEIDNQENNIPCDLSYQDFQQLDEASTKAAQAIKDTTIIIDPPSPMEDERSTFDSLKKRRAREIMEAEDDPDVGSIQAHDESTRLIKNTNNADVDSVSSEMTDLTDNTTNRPYFNDDADDRTVASENSLYSLRTLKSHDVKDMIQSGMSQKEVQDNIRAYTEHQKKRAERNALVLLAKHFKDERKNNKETLASAEKPPEPNESSNLTQSTGDNMCSKQSTDNCDAGDKK